MPRKMIGLVMSSMDSETTLALYAGIKSKAQEYGYSTQGYVIYPSQRSSEAYNEGEFFMLETIDYRMYDGLIIALDTISAESTKKLVINNILNADIPMVTLDCDLGRGYKLFTSNFKSVKKIIYHLIDVHGREKINYLSGPSDNAESMLRLSAYKDAMEKRNLSYEGRIFEGTFFVEDGKAAIDYFFSDENGKDFDAIVCGNDMQAISVISELNRRGIRVPRDVSVTGFDNISDGVRISPSLTTITKDNYAVGKQAVELLNDFWCGKELPESVSMESSLIIRESCGCNGDASISKAEKEEFLNNFTFEKLFHVYNRTFVEASTECNTFLEYINVIKEFITNINPDQFSLHIHEEYAKLFELEDYPIITLIGADGSKAKMIHVIMYVNGDFLPLEVISKLPQTDFDADEAKSAYDFMPPMQYLNSPLHYMAKKIGFIAFGNSSFPTMPSLYFNWINSINITINNIYNKTMLTELYRTDSLTGLYNRFGLEYYWKKYVGMSISEGSSVNILFSDMNDLKQINDKFGHEEGDYAICVFAEALQKIESNRIKAFRYGGDEFIILCIGLSEENLKAIINKFKDELDLFSSKSGKPYKISSSIGYYTKIASSDMTLEQCIEAADCEMYVEKQKYHAK